MNSQQPLEPLIVNDVAAWRSWLLQHDDSSDGVWLLLAKKGTTTPTVLSYQDALEEALCSGWIDGQRRSRDAHTYVQRFTPRRARSIWSQRNVGIIAELSAAGRLRARGIAEVERAKADGRWERAYAGPATAEVPRELTVALEESPAAQRAFDALSRAERYSALHPILTAPSATTRTRRVAALIARWQNE